MLNNFSLEKYNNFNQKKISTNNKKLNIKVISDITFQPLDRYLPFYFDKFEINPSFSIGNFDQLNFDLLNLSKKDFKKYHFLYVHSSTLKYFSRASGIKNFDFTNKFKEFIEQYYFTVKKALNSNENINFILNLFELPPFRIRGTYSTRKGIINTIQSINEKIINLSESHKNLIIHDMNYISSSIGLNKWYDFNSWAAYKQPFSGEALKYLAASLASTISASIGKSKKLLISDLDNTLWGGVIGDDGVDKIDIGLSTPKGEIYLFIQSFLKSLQSSGIILGISSKNEVKNAKLGFSNQHSILNFNDFVNKKINWLPKSENIKSMLKELNLKKESMVFIDDNPVEIDEVSKAIPRSECLSFQKNPIELIKLIDALGLFETQNITDEDLLRNKSYEQNINRSLSEKTFSSQNQFLQSLKMRSNFYWNKTNDVQRISDLVNKTNQFNTTQKTLSVNEVDEYISNPKKFITSANLDDKFGSNGIITVIFGELNKKTMFVKNWVMSCRVFNRTMENAMLNVLKKKAFELDIKVIEIAVKKSPKNNYCLKFFEESKLKKKLHSSSKTIYTLNPSISIKNEKTKYESKINFKIY